MGRENGERNAKNKNDQCVQSSQQDREKSNAILAQIVKSEYCASTLFC